MNTDKTDVGTKSGGSIAEGEANAVSVSPMASGGDVQPPTEATVPGGGISLPGDGANEEVATGGGESQPAEAECAVETSVPERILELENVMAGLPERLPEDKGAADGLIAEVLRAAVAESAERRRAALRELITKYPSLDSAQLKRDLKRLVYEAERGPLDPPPGQITKVRDLKAWLQMVQAAKDTPKGRKNSATLKAILQYLDYRQAMMFYPPSGDPHLLFDGKDYRLDKRNNELASLILEITDISVSTSEGKAIVQGLRDSARIHGEPVAQSRCLLTDHGANTIFINANNNRGEILRVYPGGVEVVPNGANAYGVYLLPSNISAVNYDPGVDVEEGLRLYRDLVFNNIPCATQQRYFIVSWPIASLLDDYTHNKTIIKLSGASDNGKSTVAEMETRLFLGKPQLETSRKTDDLYLLADQTPLLMLENLETKDLTRGMIRFLLCASTGAVRTKRRLYTDSEQVSEHSRCFVCVTGIEPFGSAELINRTFDIEMDRHRFGAADFNKTTAMGAIAANRDRMLSAILKFLAVEILPSLPGRLEELLQYLSQRHRGHFTERCNETTALAAIIGEELGKHFGGDGNARSLIDEWVRSQNERNRVTMLESSPIIHSFTVLAQEAGSRHPVDFEREFGLRLAPVGQSQEGGRIVFESSARGLLPAISRICREYGYTRPFRNAASLAARLKNDESSLVEVGWTIRWNVRTIRGIATHEFVYSLNR